MTHPYHSQTKVDALIRRPLRLSSYSTKFSMEDKITSLHYSLGTSDLRGKTLEEKIVYAKVHLNLSQRKIASSLRCHPSKVQRTIEAYEDSRDLGVNGRPNHLNKKELDDFVTLVKSAIDQGAVVDYDRASRMAREVYIASRQSHLKENVPNFDSKWVKRVFDQHGIRMVDPTEVEEEQGEMYIERENLDETQLGGHRAKRKVATKRGVHDVLEGMIFSHEEEAQAKKNKKKK